VKARFVAGLVPPASRDEPALWFVFRGRDLLVHDEVDLRLFRDLAELGVDAVRSQFLGWLDGVPAYSVEVPRDAAAPPGARFRDIRALYGRADEEHYALAGRAVQIMDWDRSHQYCGACAEPTVASSSERARSCPRCGLVVFPRIAPAVIVAVEREGRILLARSPHFPPRFYSVPAGFVEPGESLEQAVVREILEETGVTVEDVRYFGSQPWPYPNSLMVGFEARWKDGEIRVDGEELEDAGWFAPDAMPPYFKGRISISGWLIEEFLRRHGAA
jgi:NAD+ diphosphatase